MQGCRKHIDYEDRKFIESSLDAGMSLAFMARKLEMDPSSIAREVTRNAGVIPRKYGNSGKGVGYPT